MTCRKLLYGWLIATCSIPALLQSQELPAQEAKGSRSLTVIAEDVLSIKLKYTLPTPDITAFKIANQDYYTLSLKDHGSEPETGRPAVPVYSTLIDLSGREVADIRISAVRTGRIYPESMGFKGLLMPAVEPGTKGSDSKNVQYQQEPTPYRQDEDYRSLKPSRSDTITIEYLGTNRGIKIGNLSISPVFYYPVDNYIDMITEMDIELTFKPSPELQVSDNFLKSVSATSLLGKGLIDYNPEEVIPGFSLGPVGLVIVSDTIMKKHLAPLVEWKIRKGFRVTEIYIGKDGIIKSFDSIKEKLRELFSNSSPENPAPEYIILAGDINYIPASAGTSWLSDMYYAEFDGSGDFLPDAYIGRLPAKDTTQMKSIVKKILDYEQFNFADTIKHYESALAFTGYDIGNIPYMNGQVNYSSQYLDPSNDIMAHLMLHSNNDSIRSVRYDSVKFLMNTGLGFINYTGHGDATGWLSTGINSTFAATLTNSLRYPVVISNACQTANYANTNCFGSTLVRLSNRGALAFIGCSNDSYWTEDFIWAVGVSQITENPTFEESGPGFYDRLFHTHLEKPSKWYFTLGQILHAGNMAVSESTSSKKKYYWETYTLLGDPSIIPYIGKPSEFDESLPDSIPTELKTLTLATEPFSYVALSHFDTLWDASHSSTSGAVLLEIPDGVKDSCLLVITGQNRIPFRKTLYFFDPDTAWLNIIDINPDDINGNGNGLADYSESISLEVNLQNAGDGTATETYLLLSSDSQYVTILNDSVVLGDISGLSEDTYSELFSIRINDSIPDLEIAGFKLSLCYGTNRIEQLFDLSLHSPSPLILNCYADDSVTGNGNNLAEAGEKVKIIVRITNNGSSSASGELLLTPVSEYISFEESLIATGTVSPGEVIQLEFNATIGEDTPEATNIDFLATLDWSPYITSKELSIFSGKSTEDFELQNFTTFPWKNSTTFPWIISETEAYRNSFSARSGLSSQNSSQSSVLSLFINLPENDTLSFWYKVSSEFNYDWFIFRVDGAEMFRKSGQTDWTELKTALTRGVHQLEWGYTKDASISEGLDCAWIDFLRFPELAFLKNDISVNRFVSPVMYQQYGFEPVSVEVTNLGRDTVNSVELSYILNDHSPVSQQFFTNIVPGDTVELTFGIPVDLAEPGNYFLGVFPSLPDEYAVNDTVNGIFISYNYLIQVGPNPFDSRINFISQGHYDNVSIRVYSMSGILLKEELFDEFLPGQIISMDIPGLAGGMYIIKVKTVFGTSTYKVIKR